MARTHDTGQLPVPKSDAESSYLQGSIGEVNPDSEKFLAYMNGNAPEGKFTQDIAEEMERVKLHKETRLEYITFAMELKEQRRDGEKAV